MKKSIPIVLLALSGCGLRADWLTFGGNPQRTGFSDEETPISKQTAGLLTLDWKLQLDNQAKELNSLTAPVIVESVYTARGVKDILIVASASDKLFAIDAERGQLLWQKTFQAEGASKQESHWLCPNALNATPVIEKRETGLGEMTVYSIASDGKLHALNVVDGEDRMPPLKFVPPFSKNWSLNVVNEVLYTSTSQNCNGGKSGIHSMQLSKPDRPATFFPTVGGVWGRGGVAVGASGAVFAETGDGPYDPRNGKFSDSVVELAAGDLKLLDYYTPANREWITKKDLDMGNMTPVVFPFQGRELVAAAGKEGLIYLLDSKSMGGADHRTPLFRSPLYTNEDVDFAGRGFWGSFATWEDAKGTRWLYAPAWGPVHSKAPKFLRTWGDAPNGGIMAFKVEEKEAGIMLTPAWMSRDIAVPEPPIVINGVVFAVSSGENVRQLDKAGKILDSHQRASAPAGNAVLHAFDAGTGKELFSSGKTMPSFTHFSGIAAASGRVFVTTWDSTVYAFGLKQP